MHCSNGTNHQSYPENSRSSRRKPKEGRHEEEETYCLSKKTEKRKEREL